MTELMSIRDLTIEFPVSTPIAARLRGERRTICAVDSVSLTVARGEALAIVGESGCGKSTLARAICGLIAPSRGSVSWAAPPDDVADTAEGVGGRSGSARPRVQMVFQDPTSSLNPRQPAGDAVLEVLAHHRMVPEGQLDQRVGKLFSLVGLPDRSRTAFLRQLSGGQRQRVCIARALAVEPELLIADEAVASLDVSVKAGILGVLRDIRERSGLSLIHITHDLGTVRHVADRVAVMYCGRIVEEGPAAEVLDAPSHPYARALIAAVPRLHQRRAEQPPLRGEPPSPLRPPTGCAFHERCPVAIARCASERPDLHGAVHGVACHLAVTAGSPSPDQRSGNGNGSGTDPASQRLQDLLPDPVEAGGTGRDETARPTAENPEATRGNGTRRDRPERTSSS